MKKMVLCTVGLLLALGTMAQTAADGSRAGLAARAFGKLSPPAGSYAAKSYARILEIGELLSRFVYSVPHQCRFHLGPLCR